MAESRLCSIPGCGNRHDSHGYCGRHAKRYRRHGDPLAGGTANGAPAQFIEYALSQETDDCIIWPYAKTKRGYAQLGDRKMVSRIICERAHGEPPSPGYEAAHSCGAGHLGCVNGRHIRWATHQENCADRADHDTNTVGSRNAMAKLTEGDVLEILRLRGVVSQATLACQFGISVATISLIQRRKRWAHVSAGGVSSQDI